MTSHFRWTDAKELEFVKLVYKNQGHIKSDVSYKEKWEGILTELKSQEGFKDLSIKYPALQQKFKQIQKTHEVKALASQRESFNLAADQKSDSSSPSADQRSDSSSPSADDKDSKTSSSSGEGKEKGPSSSSSSSKGGMDKFTESMEEKNEAIMKTPEEEEKAMNLRHKEIEFQDRQEEKRRRLELVARCLAFVEKTTHTLLAADS